MSQSVVQTVLAADLATNGTITVGYPAGKTRGDFLNGSNHYVIIGQSRFDEPAGASFAFGASSIVITYRGTGTMLAGSAVAINLDEPGATNFDELPLPANVERAAMVTIDLGSPDVADPDGIAASQSASGAALINGALAAGGVATFDVPRNVVGAWTGASTITIQGVDQYGNAMTEEGASGTTFTGKKAFKSVTEVSFGSAVTLATVGSGDVLGLPIWVPGAGHVVKELQDGAAAAAGTTVGGLATGTVSTKATADVRGTYDPNAACDGSKAFKLVVLVEDPTFLGNDQYHYV